MPSNILNLKNDRKQFKNDLYRYLLNNSFYFVKDFLELNCDNLINYFCCNLYCLVLLLCYAQYLISETVVLTFLYLCYIVSFLLFFLTSFMSDCCVTEFVDLRNDMCVCVCVCVYVCMYVHMYEGVSKSPRTMLITRKSLVVREFPARVCCGGIL